MPGNFLSITLYLVLYAIKLTLSPLLILAISSLIWLALPHFRKMPSVSRLSGFDRKSMQTFIIGGISWSLLFNRIHSREAPNCWLGNLATWNVLGLRWAPDGFQRATIFLSFLERKKKKKQVISKICVYNKNRNLKSFLYFWSWNEWMSGALKVMLSVTAVDLL